MNDLLFSFYKTAFLSIVRGNHRGVVINAKPLYYITIIDLIDGNADINELDISLDGEVEFKKSGDSLVIRRI